MTDLDLVAYKGLYLETARQHLSDLKNNLLQLNQSPTDQKIIYEIFRLFHSLKSQNYFMGFEKTANLCKVAENYFREIKDGARNYNSNFSHIIQDAILKIENSLTSIEKENKETDISSDIISLESNLS
ncbi:hypothetical protein A3C98_04395 [Candidatus Roizmanbacteria bacterium RIFCSPHIGHO2_02_FULL_37_15]|uniref:HPt domain-containing protein n=1 Tax=Candidatus Roizmanbacteria bacterium RIFCSPLOWO2_01_FULL_37_16 TaxID=1802058 RepID=A0A1F7IIN0_9BACT|nr:MAG: hypothetical protein A2859_01015 [Candidatus Roizmanbacteria bacterium RIFCSPHIGHO2_01_FULL_37_16b]OGK20732.1 MAG: hypothetical protein A3C98_04395 [Candidatus Roizmanbacteria bacterium RIFCSPHIGHO2_02_FULL_37_15]OGK33323.1 MAG: hypothetical protein A3F57_05275 [Candidatus Roizmanbacteria bacterium RIFCSPHIGHO2_12_FULL_36_11]OGK43213.1 MAG: hypothetical protein A3B40_03040 [Candidatus Roizmanbacteria bacterium RIFCSPLOWO2_01_FULL_37_16]OGK57637.1 MAG: hypothetical protein A3I50_00755 [C